MGRRLKPLWAVTIARRILMAGACIINAARSLARADRGMTQAISDDLHRRNKFLLSSGTRRRQYSDICATIGTYCRRINYKIFVACAPKCQPVHYAGNHFYLLKFLFLSLPSSSPHPTAHAWGSALAGGCYFFTSGISGRMPAACISASKARLIPWATVSPSLTIIPLHC